MVRDDTRPGYSLSDTSLPLPADKRAKTEPTNKSDMR